MTLRRRILLMSTGLTALVLLLTAIPLALVVRATLIDHATREAQYVAESVADYLSTGRYDVPQLENYLQRQGNRDSVVVSVTLPDGAEVGDTMPDDVPAASAGRGQDPDRDGDRDEDHEGLDRVSGARVTDLDDGRLVGVEVSTPSGTALVRVFSAWDDLENGVLVWWAVIAAASLGLLLLSAMVAELVVRRMVRSLDATAETAVVLSGGDLSARAPVEGPREVAEVATALNVLAGRIDGLVEKERETFADLSHQLRTPLTAVRLGVDNLPPGPWRAELSDHVARLERTLTGVILTARGRPARLAGARTDVARVARGRAEFWHPLAQDQQRSFDVEVTAGVVNVEADPEQLAAAIDALLENVIAHTPDGTAMRLRVERSGRFAHLDILDAGPGIPPRSGTRGLSDRGSSGLGLDIARRCAEGADGSLEISREEAWTRVRLILPTAGTDDSQAAASRT